MTQVCFLPCLHLHCRLLAGYSCVWSLRGIMLLSCDIPSQTLSAAKVASVGENFIPTSLGSSISGGFLWMITGASKLRGSDLSSLSREKVLWFQKKKSGFFGTEASCSGGY